LDGKYISKIMLMLA